MDGPLTSGGSLIIDAANAYRRQFRSPTFAFIFDASGTLVQTVEICTSREDAAVCDDDDSSDDGSDDYRDSEDNDRIREDD